MLSCEIRKQVMKPTRQTRVKQITEDSQGDLFKSVALHNDGCVDKWLVCCSVLNCTSGYLKSLVDSKLLD